MNNLEQLMQLCELEDFEFPLKSGFCEASTSGRETTLEKCTN